MKLISKILSFVITTVLVIFILSQIINSISYEYSNSLSNTTEGYESLMFFTDSYPLFKPFLFISIIIINFIVTFFRIIQVEEAPNNKENNDNLEVKKPHKQTYLEYVIERRKIERLMGI